MHVVRSMWIFRHKMNFEGSFERYKARIISNGRSQQVVVDSEKSLYGLKQTPRAWYQWYVDFVSTIGFIHSKSDHSLFIYRDGSDEAYLLLYVDDIILTTSTASLRTSLMSKLTDEFAMKVLEP
ncbi:copia protein [Tanacetum coccineum]